MTYKPYDERVPDGQYQAILKRILEHGEFSETRQGPRAKTVIGVQMHFDLANGFPVITDRSLGSFWRKPIGELCAFMNGARTREQLAEFGCTWWGPWTSDEKTAKRGLAPGDIGPGSYGAAFHDFPTADGGSFDQFKHLVEQIRELPELRTHFVTPWIPQYIVRGQGKQQKVTIAPCHGWVHVRIINDKLHLHMFQRSGDVPIGVPSNMVQYAALALMLEHLTGFEAVEYVHTISDAHIYEDQIPLLEPLLEREPLRLPTVVLNEAGRAVKDIHDFRAEHFELSDYHPHPSIPKNSGGYIMVALIVAQDENGVIGRDNDLPWRLPADLKHFKTLTVGHSVVMGRKTYESIAVRLGGPLPERRNIVVTHDAAFAPAGATVAHSLEEALAAGGEGEVFVIGGASLYKQSLVLADVIYLTQVKARVEGDTFFPKLAEGEWRELDREHHAADERHEYAFDWVTLRHVRA